jgi:DNA-binding response OmpR family regulator
MDGGSVHQGFVIAVVDDNEDALDLLCEGLRSHGHRPCGARSAREARGLLASPAVDALITDYAMPDEDGLSLVAHVRSDPRVAGMVCAMVSGHVEPMIEARARALDALWFSKPCDVDTVVAAVVGQLRAQRCAA